MYHGIIRRTIPNWVDEYRPGIGTFSYKYGTREEPLHRFECERCGHIAEVIEMPAEPFFCSGCNRLIGIETKGR